MNSLSVTNLPVLAGATSGKTVRYVPAVEGSIKRLLRAAEDGNYYPLLAIKQLSALTTGMIGKANVYIPPENLAANHTYQQFDVYVPGIKARVERRSDNSYVVAYLELSGGWDRLREGNKKPGVYRVTRAHDFDPVYQPNGEIEEEPNRTVVITDGGYESAERAASEGFRAIAKSPRGGLVKHTGKFDLVFSPAGMALGGGKQYDPALVVQSYGNAAILANAIMAAQGTEGVYWTSQAGGSAVLTQAMQMLANRNVNLSKSNHGIYMYKPTTSRCTAVALAHQIGVKLDAGHASLAYTPRSVIDDFSAKRLRVKSDSDSYSFKDYAQSLATYVAGGAGVAGAVAWAGGLPAIAALLAPAAATACSYTGMVAGGVGATGVVVKVSCSLYEDISRKKQ